MSGQWAGCHLLARTWPEDVCPPGKRTRLCVGVWPLGQSTQKNLMPPWPREMALRRVGGWGVGGGRLHRLIVSEMMRPSPSPPSSCLLPGGQPHSRQKPHLGSPPPGETACIPNLLFFFLILVNCGKIHVTQDEGFPHGSAVKNLPASAGDAGWIPGLGRSPGEGNGKPLQYSCLENTMDGGAWRATVHGVAKSWTRLGD